MNIKRIGTVAAVSLAAISLTLALPLSGKLAKPALAAEQTAKPGTSPETLSYTYRFTRANDVEFQKIAPFKVFDNLYYVGPGYVGVWLIPTSAGIIMIDSAQEPYVDFVMDNVKKVGFDLKDIKYILLSHGHLDHFGGAARIQEASGARVGTTEEDWQMIEQAGSRPGRDGAAPPRVPKRDMVIKEGDTLTLGGTTINFYHHPGHTPGVLSGVFTVYDNGVPHKALWQGGGGSRGGLVGAEQAVDTTNRLAQMQGIEVLVMIHSWSGGNAPGPGYPGGGVLERALLLKDRKPGDPNPFVDPTAWAQSIKAAQANAVRTLAAEKAKAAGTEAK
jgi:metallo-beta-lactamase class B